MRVLQETITAIDPVARRVTTDAGVHEADVLVVALGADYDVDATPGLAEAGNEFYSVAGRQRHDRRGTSCPWPLSFAATASSSRHDSNGRFSVRRRCGLSTPTLAGLASSSPHSCARFSTCRSACVASKRWPYGIVIRHAAISGERSCESRRSPNTSSDFVSSQRSLSIVSGYVGRDLRGRGHSPPCWRR